MPSVNPENSGKSWHYFEVVRKKEDTEALKKSIEEKLQERQEKIDVSITVKSNNREIDGNVFLSCVSLKTLNQVLKIRKALGGVEDAFAKQNQWDELLDIDSATFDDIKFELLEVFQNFRMVKIVIDKVRPMLFNNNQSSGASLHPIMGLAAEDIAASEITIASKKYKSITIKDFERMLANPPMDFEPILKDAFSDPEQQKLAVEAGIGKKFYMAPPNDKSQSQFLKDQANIISYFLVSFHQAESQTTTDSLTQTTDSSKGLRQIVSVVLDIELNVNKSRLEDPIIQSKNDFELSLKASPFFKKHQIEYAHNRHNIGATLVLVYHQIMSNLFDYLKADSDESDFFYRLIQKKLFDTYSSPIFVFFKKKSFDDSSLIDSIDETTTAGNSCSISWLEQNILSRQSDNSLAQKEFKPALIHLAATWDQTTVYETEQKTLLSVKSFIINQHFKSLEEEYSDFLFQIPEKFNQEYSDISSMYDNWKKTRGFLAEN